MIGVSSLPEALVARARAAHDTPGRHYHTFEHVAEVLERLAEAARDVGRTTPLATTLAAVFHDAVYVVGRRDNEAESAKLARHVIDEDMASATDEAPRVEQLILLTARHGALAAEDVDVDAAFFVDADMAILGAAPERFAAYDRDIALEYAAVPSELFAAGRKRFLEGLLARPRVYLSDYFHARFDAPARANLRRAIADG
jgi:predicted metal-dependent HD superfamily phosphohydrolase